MFMFVIQLLLFYCIYIYNYIMVFLNLLLFRCISLLLLLLLLSLLLLLYSAYHLLLINILYISHYHVNPRHWTSLTNIIDITAHRISLFQVSENPKHINDMFIPQTDISISSFIFVYHIMFVVQLFMSYVFVFFFNRYWL